MSKEYRKLYTEIIAKVITRKRITMNEIDDLITYAFNEGYDACMLDEIEVNKMMKEIENEKQIDE